MKMSKQILSALLTAGIIAGAASGCSTSSSSSSQSTGSSGTTAAGSQSSSSPESTAQPDSEPVKLKGWGAFTFNDTTGISSYEQQISWQNIEKELNLDIEWEVVTSASNNAATQFGLIMASGNMPDFFVEVDPMHAEEFGSKGGIMPVNTLLDKMPELQRWMDSDPGLVGSITSADGNIYFLPRILHDVGTRCWPGFMIRQDWLDEVGLSVPTTTDEFYETLKAFKEKIPTAEKPYGGDIKPLIWSFGVGSRGTGNNRDDTFIENGEIKYGPTDPRFRDAVEYLNKLVKEGLIDPEWNGLSGDQLTTNIVNGTTGASYGSFAGGLGKYNTLFAKDGKTEPFVAVPPLKGPTGFVGTQGMHTSIDPSWGGAVSITCKNTDAVAKLFNYTYSEEGRYSFYYGNEGDTYEVKDGKRAWTEKVTSSELGILGYLNNYVGNTSCYPSVLPLDFYQSTLSEAGIAGNEITTKNAGELKTPTLRYSQQEIETVNAILRDLNSYVDENVAGFVNGQKDFSEWDAFQAGFQRLRVEEFMEINKAAYDRFKAAIA